MVVNINDYHVLQRRKSSPDPVDLLQETLLGDYNLRPCVAKSVQQRIFTKVGKQRAGYKLHLEGAKDREELFRHLGEEREQNVTLREPERGKNIGESITLQVEISEGVIPPCLV